MVSSIAGLSLCACRDDVAWSKTVPLDSDGWLPEYVVEFQLDPAAYAPDPENRFAQMTARAIGDTVPRILGDYDAVLSVRYLKDANAGTLRLVVEQESLDSPTRTDTIAIRMFDADGEPAGSGHLGIFESRAHIPGPFKVSDGTTLSVRPIVYADTVRGITDVTLLLLKH